MDSPDAAPAESEVEHRFPVRQEIFEKQKRSELGRIVLSWLVSLPFAVLYSDFGWAWIAITTIYSLYLFIKTRQRMKTETEKILVIRDGNVAWHVGENTRNAPARFITTITEYQNRVRLLWGRPHFEVHRDEFSPEDYEKILHLLREGDFGRWRKR